MKDEKLFSDFFFLEHFNYGDICRLQHIAKELYERLEELEEVSINEDGEVYWNGNGEQV